MTPRITILLLSAALAFGAAACTKSASNSQGASGDSTASAMSGDAQASAAAAPAGGDAAHGKEIFEANCATCHASDGSGGVGPSLKNEKSRKNTAAAIAWIKNPKPPMPKLYPSPLNDKDVADVAAFVETL